MNDEVLLGALERANASIEALRAEVQAGREAVEARIAESESALEASQQAQNRLRLLVKIVAGVATVSLLAAVGSVVAVRRACDFSNDFRTGHNALVLSFETLLVSARDQTLASPDVDPAAKDNAVKFYDEQIANVNKNILPLRDCSLIGAFTG